MIPGIVGKKNPIVMKRRETATMGMNPRSAKAHPRNAGTVRSEGMAISRRDATCLV